MQHGLVIAHLWLPVEQEHLLLEFQGAVQGAIGIDPRYQSFSIWRDCQFPEKYVALLHHTGGVEGEEIFEPVMKLGEVQRMVMSLRNSPDLHSVGVHGARGRRPDSVMPGGLMSVSYRTADPGKGEDLLDEMSGILDSLQYLDGYLGYVYGPSYSVEEEITGIVFWAHREGFEASMPRGSFYEIRLFERIS